MVPRSRPFRFRKRPGTLVLGWRVTSGKQWEMPTSSSSQRHSRYEPPGHWKQTQGGIAVQHAACLHVVVTKWTDWLPQSTSDPPKGGEVSPCRHRLVFWVAAPGSPPPVHARVMPRPGL